MKIYLAGPMTGIRDDNFPAFDAASESLRSEGYDVCNPADLNRRMWPIWYGMAYKPKGGLTPDEYRRTLVEDIRIISECDAVYLLPGWQDSKGARAEVAFAQACGLTVKELGHDHETIPQSPAQAPLHDSAIDAAEP